MRRKLLVVLAGLAASAGITWAGTLDLNPADFPTTIDWCQLGCPYGVFSIASPTGWVSSGADTGKVWSVSHPNLWNAQEGTGPGNWRGNFAPGMGVIYNGADYLGTGSDILLTFDQAEFGAGAYIDPAFPFGFTATITLYNNFMVSLGSYAVGGVSNHNNDGSAMFLGAFDTSADVWAVQFDSVGVGGSLEPDFAIATAGLYAPPPAPTPEPSSLLLLGSGLIGILGVCRRRHRSFRSRQGTGGLRTGSCR